MNKVYWSDVANETWHDTSDYMTYVLVPRKWWSIKAWRKSIEFSKDIQLFFMKYKESEDET